MKGQTVYIPDNDLGLKEFDRLLVPHRRATQFYKHMLHCSVYISQTNCRNVRIIHQQPATLWQIDLH